MRLGSWRAVALACALALSPAAHAQNADVDQILDCLQRTRPLTNTVRTIELGTRDRAGAERVLRAKLYGGISREGLRTLLVRVTAPADVRGLSVLITERVGANHLFVSPAGLPVVRQIKGAPGRSSLFRTDFSYEDLERLYGLERPDTHGLGATGDSPGVWLLETTPSDGSGSAYRRIVSRVDRETCVLMRAEMYGSGTTPRKVLTVDPGSISKEGSVWVAHDLLMRDLRDGSQTRMIIDEIELEAENEGLPFTPGELEEYKRSRAEEGSE